MKHGFTPRTAAWIAWISGPALGSLTLSLTSGFWITLLRGSEEAHWLDGLLLVFPAYFVFFPALGTILIALVLLPRIRTEPLGRIVKAVLLGLLLQGGLWLLSSSAKHLVDLLRQPTDLSLSDFAAAPLWHLFLFIPTAVAQGAFAGIFFGISRIQRFSVNMSAAVSLILLAALAAGGFLGQEARSRQAYRRAAEERHLAQEAQLVREHIHREPAKQGTFLGDLAKRPYRVFRKTDGSYFTIDADGKEARPPLPALPDRDLEKALLFDVFGGRVFYFQKNGTVASYTPEAGIQPLPQIKEFISTPACGSLGGCTYHPTLRGAHGPYLAFERTVWAGTANIAVFDIRTGKREVLSTYAGYDLRRVYQFWIEGRGYRLILDATAEPESFPDVKSGGAAERTWQPPERTMRFYLESFEGAPHEVPDEDFLPTHSEEDRILSTPAFPWASVAFRMSPSEYLAQRMPFFAFASTVPGPATPRFGDDVRYFTVRSLYRLDSGHIGLEVNDALLVIDLSTRTVTPVTDEQDIEKRLARAIPIAVDDDDPTGPGYCPENDDTLERTRDGATFEGCVF
jgi:hypothetical protein